jgi:hypothetical protein
MKDIRTGRPGDRGKTNKQEDLSGGVRVQKALRKEVKQLATNANL